MRRKVITSGGTARDPFRYRMMRGEVEGYAVSEGVRRVHLYKVEPYPEPVLSDPPVGTEQILAALYQGEWGNVAAAAICGRRSHEITRGDVLHRERVDFTARGLDPSDVRFCLSCARLAERWRL